MAEKRWEIVAGDCLETLKTLADCSVDSVVTDPPYGLRFMGKAWDCNVPSVDVWRECLRVLKPGGHLLAFAGTRTQHRMACAIEDAGFEIRDMIAWVYGVGFPKSHDVSKAIDKAAGAEREVVGVSSVTGARKSRTMDDGNKGTRRTYQNDEPVVNNITTPATEAARQWQGWGTALKPALEPITVARKPLCGTVANNVLEWGTGAINVDGCRVGDEVRQAAFTSFAPCHGNSLGKPGTAEARRGTQGDLKTYNGRWPANIVHDGSDEVVGLFPETTSGSRKAGRHLVAGGQGRYGLFSEGDLPEIVGDSGSAARFFYCAKASKRDRDDGCEGLESRARKSYSGPESRVGKMRSDGAIQNASETVSRNNHPTVKPTDLMRYLVRLVTPPGGLVLDPFAGTGSTGRGAILEGFCFLGCEIDANYAEIARLRIKAVAKEVRQPELF